MKYIYPTHLRPIIYNDHFGLLCKYHWSKLKHILPKDSNQLSTLNLWADQGCVFETNESASLIKQFGQENVLLLSKMSNFNFSHDKTVQAMRNNVPFIIEGHLENKLKGMRAICDLLIRSDYIDKLPFKYFPAIVHNEKNKGCKFSDKFHYIPVDFKLGSLSVYSERGKKVNNYLNFELSGKQDHMHNRNQLLFEMDILEHMQNYKPQYGFNITHNGAYISKTKYNTWDIPCVIYNKFKHRNVKPLHDNYQKFINRAKEIASFDIPPNMTLADIQKFCQQKNIIVNMSFEKDDFGQARKIVFPPPKTPDHVILGLQNTIKSFENKTPLYKNTENPIILSIDNEYIPDMRIMDLKSDLRSLVYLIGISRYDSSTKKKIEYKNFYADGLNIQSEQLIVKEFANYLNTITENGKKPFVMYHWYNPELKDVKKWIKNYAFLEMCPYFDMNKHMVDLHKQLKTIDHDKQLKVIGYGLKPVAKFMHKYRAKLGIPNIKDWPEEISGEDTIALRLQYHENQANANYDISKNMIIKYNENDCDTVAEILFYLHKL